MRRNLLRSLALVVAATVGLVATAQADPGRAELAAGVWALVVSIIGSQALLRCARPPLGRPPREDPFARRAARRATQPWRSPQLAVLEGMVSETTGSSGDPQGRLLGLLGGRGAVEEGMVTGQAGARGPLRIDLAELERLVTLAEERR